jgi:hypothetical protein
MPQLPAEDHIDAGDHQFRLGAPELAHHISP